MATKKKTIPRFNPGDILVVAKKYSRDKPKIIGLVVGYLDSSQEYIIAVSDGSNKIIYRECDYSHECYQRLPDW